MNAAAEFSTALVIPRTAPLPVATSKPPSGSARGLSGGELAGVVLGAVAGLLLLAAAAALLWICWAAGRSHKAKDGAESRTEAKTQNQMKAFEAADPVRFCCYVDVLCLACDGHSSHC